MKFKAIQILALLTVIISLNLLENILGQSIGIQLLLGNQWDSEYPEHKTRATPQNMSNLSSRKRGGSQEIKKKESEKERYKKQVNSGLLY